MCTCSLCTATSSHSHIQQSRQCRRTDEHSHSSTELNSSTGAVVGWTAWRQPVCTGSNAWLLGACLLACVKDGV